MKKFILGLFLILGVVSFAAPDFVNLKKIEDAGYTINKDGNNHFSFSMSDQESALTIAFLKTDLDPKVLNDNVRYKLSNKIKFLTELENSKAYVTEYKTDKSYIYIIIPKNQKVKDYSTRAEYYYVDRLSKDAVDRSVDIILKEIDSYIK